MAANPGQGPPLYWKNAAREPGSRGSGAEVLIAMGAEHQGVMRTGPPSH